MTERVTTQPRDCIFGVCAAVADDFGFDPSWLRLAVGAALMWNLELALGSYVVLGLIVLVSRIAVPARRPSPAARIDAAVGDDAAVANDRGAPEDAVRAHAA